QDEVDILRRACIVFRKMFLERGDVCPFVECTTIAFSMKVFVSCELRKALEKGYLVTSVCKIWHFRVTRFDPCTKQSGLFAEYINYLREHEETENIVLSRNNIVRNRGLHLVAKHCLNSFWGKFGQRIILPNTEIVKKYERLTMLFTSSEHEITNIRDLVLSVSDEIPKFYAYVVHWKVSDTRFVIKLITRFGITLSYKNSRKL
ncbi:hypothetical protein ALC56_07107, partial [Trachymyrmex septentrionalis]